MPPRVKVPLTLAWREWSRLQCAVILLLLVAGLFELIAGSALPFAGYDTYNHLYWIGQWHKLWSMGIFYPRWLPDSYAGFGAPTFYFYPPFTYVLTSALSAAMPGMTPEAIGKILALLTLVLSGFTMWLYLRWKFPDRWTNIFAALLYMFAPYRFFDYSTRGALSEHVSLVFVPLLFWGLDRIAERRDERELQRGFALLLFGIALMLITNLPTAVVALIGIAIYALAQKGQARTRALAWSASAVVLAGILCAFYLLPAYALRGDARIGRLWTPVPIAWSSPLTAIFTGENITINSYSLLMYLGALVLFAALLRNQKSNRQWLGILVAVIVLQLPILSYYLFWFVPPFTIAQLPYRLSILVLIVAAIIWQNELRGKTGVAASFIVATWSLAVIGLVAFQFTKFHVHPDDRLPVGDAPEYASRWEHPPPFQKHGQQAYLDFAAALAAPFANDSQSILLPGGKQPTRAKREIYSDTIDYTSEISGQALLHYSYWPAWRASIDGISAQTAPDSLGRLTIVVPEGRHRVIVWLETSTAANTGIWVSFFTFLLLTISWIFTRRSNQSATMRRLLRRTNLPPVDSFSSQ